MQSFLVALGFLTIVPVRFPKLLDDGTVARSRLWFPVVGVLLGGLLAGWTFVLTFLTPPLAAFLVLPVWVVLTGALHVDGFCDLCDGLFGGWTPEDRLRIMRDPQRGTFGVVGGCLLMLGKFVALQELLHKSAPYAGPWAVGMAVLTARCLVLTAAAGARYPRAEGTGKVIIEATRNFEAVLFAIVALVAVCVYPLTLQLSFAIPATLVDPDTTILQLLPHFEAMILVPFLFLPAWLAVVGVRKLCERRLGGITGDCLGAVIETAEGVFLLSAAISIP